MNKLHSISLTLLVFVLALGFQPVMGSSTPSLVNANSTTDDIVGSWVYDVQNVDPQYEKGILHIAKENGKYELHIQGAEDNLIPTEELSVKGNEAKFVVYVEGDRVAITLKFEGDTFTGEGSSSNGPFTLSGNRIPDPK